MAALTDIRWICYDVESCSKCPFWRRSYIDGSWECYFASKVPGEWDDDKIEEMISE